MLEDFSRESPSWSDSGADRQREAIFKWRVFQAVPGDAERVSDSQPDAKDLAWLRRASAWLSGSDAVTAANLAGIN